MFTHTHTHTNELTNEQNEQAHRLNENIVTIERARTRIKTVDDEHTRSLDYVRLDMNLAAAAVHLRIYLFVS